MAKPTRSMEIPADAVTYLKDDPSPAIETGKKYGIKILGPGDVALLAARRVGPAGRVLGIDAEIGSPPAGPEHVAGYGCWFATPEERSRGLTFAT